MEKSKEKDFCTTQINCQTIWQETLFKVKDFEVPEDGYKDKWLEEAKVSTKFVTETLIN